MDPLHAVDLNLLVALDHLLETASVQRSASELGVGQPAMSASLSRLRRLFGDPLLVRSGRSMVRTPRAEQLRQPVGSLVGEARALLVPVAPFDPRTDAWTVCIAMGESARGWLAPRLAQRVAALAPHVDLRVRALTHGSQRDGLTGALDVAVFPHPAQSDGPDVSAFVVRALCTVRFVLALAADHPLADEPWTPRMVADAQHVLVVHWDGADRGLLDDRLDSYDLRRRVALVVPAYSDALSVVAGSTLVCMVPERLAARAGRAIRCVPLPWGEQPLPIAYAWHPRATLDARNRWFRQALVDCVEG